MSGVFAFQHVANLIVFATWRLGPLLRSVKDTGDLNRFLSDAVNNDEPIFAGVAASTVSGALEGFVRATAIELPKGLRINLVNPTILEESVPSMGLFFHGVIPVEGWKVAQAYKRAILGAQTGRVYKVD